MTKSQIPNPKSQINPNYPNSNLKSVIVYWILFGYWCLVIGVSPLFAQDNNKVVALTKQAIEAKTDEDLYITLKNLTNLYFSENKYNELIDLLASLAKQKKTLAPAVNYYTGLARYYQLKHLEEEQNWDEYFSLGNTYRGQIAASLKNSIDSLAPSDTLSVYARLLLWKFHKDQQDVFSDEALSNLISSLSEYAADTKNLVPLKDAADEILSYGEKGKAKEIYRLYVEKMLASSIKENELEEAAVSFYQEGNLDLSESIYDAYIGRILASYPKEKSIPILTGIAKKFSYKDEEQNDPVYAEKIFSKIEEIGQKDAFSEELIYLRAFNLEKNKDYDRAKDYYLDLAELFPGSVYVEKAIYKSGIIYTYILKDIETGRGYFKKITGKETVTPYLASSLYQLGLLSQWEEDSATAGSYYNQLIERAGENFSQTSALAKERVKEIAENKPIEYNLKTFLDVSIKSEYALSNAGKLELKVTPYIAKTGEDLKINSTAYPPQSGCMQVELEYLWSGDLGTTKSANTEASFSTQYLQPGTKEINLVVVSSSGVIDSNLDMVDIESK